MIKLVEQPARLVMPRHPYFAPLMESQLACYGGDKRLLLWRQGQASRPIAQVMALGGALTCFAEPCADFDELGDFLSAIGYDCVECPPQLGELLPGVRQSCVVMTKPGGRDKPSPPEEGPVELTARQLYSAASACFDGMEDCFDPWLCHFSLTQRRGRAQAMGFLERGKPVCAGALTHTGGGYGLLGYICTLPSHRGRGLATRLVAALVRQCGERGLVPSLACKREQLDFYLDCGFAPWGTIHTVWPPEHGLDPAN